MPDGKLINDVKWSTRQRLQYIEIMAYYTGLVARSDVAKAFGISDAAATKDLKLYNDLAPGNLHYQHTLFGFVPANDFTAMFADLDPVNILPMLAANLAVMGGPYGSDSIFGINTETMPLPQRLPSAQVMAQIVRGIKLQQKVRVSYRSLSDRNTQDKRSIEPHSLVNTGLRWHVRAYSNDTYDFRDFVLSRIIEAEKMNEAAESSMHYDEDWMEAVTLQLTPHPKLDQQKRFSLIIDYRAKDEIIELQIRRALVGYVLQRLMVDTSHEHSKNPQIYQLVLLNRDEIEPFAAWAFDD